MDNFLLSESVISSIGKDGYLTTKYAKTLPEKKEKL